MSTITTPDFARELNDEELSSFHGGARYLVIVRDQHGCIIDMFIIEC